jgi:DNA-binding NtrC family response regulator
MFVPIDVLVVDDDARALGEVSEALANAGCRVRTAKDATNAWNEFLARKPDIVVSDIRMPEHDGLHLLGWIRRVSDVPVILLTARADVTVAVSALRTGATDFIRFPDELPELPARVRRLVPHRGVPEPEDAATRILRGESPGMLQLREQTRALAKLEVPVLVVGEPGTGRMATARAIHELSGAKASFVVVVPTKPAVPKRRCVVLLSDVGAFDADAQRNWANALRSGAQLKRVFATADPALAARVDRGDFRAELWGRLARFRLDAPPLRGRGPDIEMFAREALQRATAALGRDVIGFTPGALDNLTRRPWPGNVPELRAVVEQAVAFATGPRIEREEIDRALDAQIAARANSVANRRAAKEDADREELIRVLAESKGNLAEAARRMRMTRGAVFYRLQKYGLQR